MEHRRLLDQQKLCEKLDEWDSDVVWLEDYEHLQQAIEQHEAREPLDPYEERERRLLNEAKGLQPFQDIVGDSDEDEGDIIVVPDDYFHQPNVLEIEWTN